MCMAFVVSVKFYNMKQTVCLNELVFLSNFTFQ